MGALCLPAFLHVQDLDESRISIGQMIQADNQWFITMPMESSTEKLPITILLM